MNEKPKDLLEQAYQEFYAGHYDRALAGFRAVLEHPEASEHDKIEAQECISIVQPEEGDAPGPSDVVAQPREEASREEEDEPAGVTVYDVHVSDDAPAIADGEGVPSEASLDDDTLPVPADPFAEMPALIEFGQETHDEGSAQEPTHEHEGADELDILMMADSQRHRALDPRVLEEADSAFAEGQEQESATSEAGAAELGGAEQAAEYGVTETGEYEAAADHDHAHAAHGGKEADQTDRFPAVPPPSGDVARTPAAEGDDDPATLDELNEEMTVQVNRVVELENELETIRDELRNRGSEVQSLHDLVRTLTNDLEHRNREIAELEQRMRELAEKQQAEREQQAEQERQRLEAERQRVARETRKLLEQEKSERHPEATGQSPQTDSYARLPQVGNGNGAGNGAGNGRPHVPAVPGNGKGNHTSSFRPTKLPAKHPSSVSVFAPSSPPPAATPEPPRHPTPAVYRSLTDAQRREVAEKEETSHPPVSAMTTRLTVSTPSLATPSSSNHMSVYTVSEGSQGLVVRTGLKRHRRPVNWLAILGCLGLVLGTFLPWHISATQMMLGVGDLGQLLSTHRPSVAPEMWLSLVDLLWLLPVFALFLLVWEGIHWGQGFNGHLMHVLVGLLGLGLILSVFALLPARGAGEAQISEVLLAHSDQLQIGFYIAVGSCVALVLAGLLWPRRRRKGRRHQVDESQRELEMTPLSTNVAANRSGPRHAPAAAAAPSSSRFRSPVAGQADTTVSSPPGLRAKT